MYPVLAGIPILLRDAASWMAAFRESIIATLAEFDLLSTEMVRFIDAFARKAGHVDFRRFSDDWVDWEAKEEGGSAIRDALPEFDDLEFRNFLTLGDRNSPTKTLLQMSGHKRSGTILEVGCGAGQMSCGLSGLSDRFVVSDYSLRAVCLARQKVSENGTFCVGLVLDATNLPFKAGKLRMIVAENLADLLHRPSRFIEHAKRALTPRGRFLLSTPDPDLESAPDPGDLRSLLQDAGFVIEEEMKRIPWIRFFHSRHLEIYFVDIFRACPELQS